MTKKLTAVEWFIENTTNTGHLWTTDKPSDMKQLVEFIKQAKEMEKQQIVDAFWSGDNTDCSKEQNSKEYAQQYYTETYGNK